MNPATCSSILPTLTIQGVGEPLAVGMQAVVLPLLHTRDEPRLVVKNLPAQKAVESYAFLRALQLKGVPVPDFTEIVQTDAYASLGIPRWALIQPDLRSRGTMFDLYANPQRVYNYANAQEIVQGIAADLAKMHSIGLTICDDILTPWVGIDRGKGRLERMVVGVAGLHQGSPLYIPETVSNVSQLLQSLCGSQPDMQRDFMDAYVQQVEYEPVPPTIVQLRVQKADAPRPA